MVRGGQYICFRHDVSLDSIEATKQHLMDRHDMSEEEAKDEIEKLLI